MVLLHMADDVVIARDETGPPTSHRIHLRQRTHLHGHVERARQRKNAGLLVAHAQSRVGEVLHDGEPVLVRKLDGMFQEPARRLRAGRIVRIIQNQHLDPSPRFGGHRVEIRQEPAFRQGWQQHFLRPAHQCHAMI